MVRFDRVALIAVGLLVCLCSVSGSMAEDCCVTISIPNAVSLDQQLTKTRPGSFMTAIPGGTFVVTVAHLSPSPEDAMVNGKPASCGAAPFRVDRLKLGTASGRVDVELGERHELQPGETRRIVYAVDRDPNDPNDTPTPALDQMGFVFRSGAMPTRCSVFANAMFYPNATSMPIPVTLIPSAHAEFNTRTPGEPTR